MIISIFSKFDMAGGSEFRCVELANGIANHNVSGYKAFLLAEKKMPDKLRQYIHPNVTVVENCFTNPEYFYQSDSIVIINTDAKDFSTIDYWIGKSSRHNFSIDLDKLKGKTMCFLYNFLVSPSRHLNQFKGLGIKVKIITTNNKFYDEITKQDRYEDIRVIPRYKLESPIDPSRLEIFNRSPNEKICFGAHSKRLDNKWNDEIYNLIRDVNSRYASVETPKIEFRFMGMKDSLRKKMAKFNNVVAMKEDEESVKDFLSKVDVFLFFPEWKREEPWARVIAEAMVSGCPVIALNRGGTSDQILNDNNGMLCKKYNDYYQAVIKFIEHKEMISEMSNNSLRISKSFYSESVIGRLIYILNN